MNKHVLEEQITVHADAYVEANGAAYEELLAATAGKLAAAGASNRAYKEAMEVVNKEQESEIAACDMVVDFIAQLPGADLRPGYGPDRPIQSKNPFIDKAVKANCIWLKNPSNRVGNKDSSPFYIVGQTEPFKRKSKREVVQLLLALACTDQASSNSTQKDRHARIAQLWVVHAWADDTMTLLGYAQGTMGTDVDGNLIKALAADPSHTIETGLSNAIMKAETVYNYGQGVGDTGFSLANLANRFRTPLSMLLEHGLTLSDGQPMDGLSDVDISRFNVSANLARLAEQFGTKQELDAAIDKNLS